MKNLLTLCIIFLSYFTNCYARWISKTFDFEEYGIAYKITNYDKVKVCEYAGTYQRDGTTLPVQRKTNNYSGYIRIPSTVYNDDSGITYSVTGIADDAFSGCTGLTSIFIPSSVISIGEYAFSRCSGLTSVTMPDSVTTIGNGAFQGCTGLTSVTISGNNITIGEYNQEIMGKTNVEIIPVIA
ncbi:MAG: leucine-rich repeat domain-containing protein [Prevotella sp.]|nr:leucine-rich repeat domain-containing protein [Prevotella sp.]